MQDELQELCAELQSMRKLLACAELELTAEQHRLLSVCQLLEEILTSEISTEQPSFPQDLAVDSF